MMQLGHEQPFRLLIHDRDTKFGGGFDEFFRTEGIKVIRMPVRAPNANAYAERWVRTVRADCLDRILIVGRRNLERVLGVYVRHYNEHRPHRALGLVPPDRSTRSPRRRCRYACAAISSAGCSTNTTQQPELARALDARFADLLGGRSITLSDLPPTEDDWYLNLLWIARQKCILLTHAGTLFSVFRAGVRSADLRPIGTYLVAAIETELRAESLPTDTFSELELGSVRLGKTASRSTLGFMNEMAFELRYHRRRRRPWPIRHQRPQPWAPSHAT